jgi:hypothetical protein
MLDKQFTSHANNQQPRHTRFQRVENPVTELLYQIAHRICPQ